MEIEKRESEEDDTQREKPIPPRGGRRRSFDRDLTQGSIIGNLWTLTWPTTISGTETIPKVMHQGLLTVYGKMINAGNMVCFGSVYVDGNYEDCDGDGDIERIGYDGIGTPTVWYDVDLADGFPLPLISAVVPHMWKVY